MHLMMLTDCFTILIVNREHDALCTIITFGDRPVIVPQGLLQKAALWPMAYGQWPYLPIVQIHFTRAPLSLYASC